MVDLPRKTTKYRFVVSSPRNHLSIQTNYKVIYLPESLQGTPILARWDGEEWVKIRQDTHSIWYLKEEKGAPNDLI